MLPRWQCSTIMPDIDKSQLIHILHIYIPAMAVWPTFSQAPGHLAWRMCVGVCMYVHTHICVCVCMYVCTCACVCLTKGWMVIEKGSRYGVCRMHCYGNLQKIKILSHGLNAQKQERSKQGQECLNQIMLKEAKCAQEAKSSSTLDTEVYDKFWPQHKGQIDINLYQGHYLISHQWLKILVSHE